MIKLGVLLTMMKERLGGLLIPRQFGRTKLDGEDTDVIY
jgi:hypothetical protein